MDIGTITTGTVASVAELIDLRDTLKPEAKAQGLKLAFRGQPREYGTLVPSFQRQFSRQSHGAAALIEGRLISAFREHYAALKDRSPDMPQPAQIAEGYDLRCLSVMQHYEIPTRLLDWTSDLWTAVYFACASEPGSKAELWSYDRRLFEAQRAYDPSLASLVIAGSSPPTEPPLLHRREQALIVELSANHTSNAAAVRSPYGQH